MAQRGEAGDSSLYDFESPKLVASEQPLTLTDCYKLALKESETIAINGELLKEAEAHFLQALGTILPHVSFASNQNFSDATSVFGSKDTYERKFVFSQTLFSGFKELAAITGSQLEKNQRINEKKRAEQLLFVDVADAFYLLLEQREDLQILESIKTVLINRIDFLRHREALGRSRRSEIVTTQAQLLSVLAQIEAGKSQEDVARQILEFLIGVPLNKIYDEGNPFTTIKPEIFYLSKAALRPDILAADFASQVAKKNIIVAKSGLLPQVTAEANYYTERTTIPQNSKWDAALKVNIPIFEGTETYGAIKDANAQARESELQLRHLNRKVFLDIRNSYTRCQKNISMAQALGKALRASEMSYFLENEDYKLSLVNNLDVLAAIRTLAENKRNFMQSLYETKRIYWQLLVAAGLTPTEE